MGDGQWATPHPPRHLLPIRWGEGASWGGKKYVSFRSQLFLSQLMPLPVVAQERLFSRPENLIWLGVVIGLSLIQNFSWSNQLLEGQTPRPWRRALGALFLRLGAP